MVNRIMLVDSSGAARKVLTRLLLKAMPEITIAGCANATEALKHVEQDRFSLITTALLLPDMDGLDFCRSIRSSKRNRYTPVIVVSSDADQRLLHEGFNAGVTDYFDKGLGFKAFGQFIKSFLARNPDLCGHILYIEDSKTAARMTRQMLEQHGMEVTHVTSVEDARSLLEDTHAQGGNGFDLVITDFHLKGEMTGGDLLYFLRVRLHYSPQALPVLVTTGNDEIHTQVEVFNAGANDFVIKPLVEEVVMARVRSLMLVKYQYDALLRQTVDMERIATTDTLTGTHNRRYLVDEGQRFLSSAENGWVMIIDLDHFKRVNDSHGHLMGDKVLMALGRLLMRRFSDALAARFGGEEFVVIAHGSEVPARVEDLRLAVEQLAPAGIEVTISIGLASVDDHPGDDLNTLLGLADEALYAAKESGRNQAFAYGKGGKIRTAALEIRF